MKTKFALFDIDNTLFRGDSLFSLYRFGVKRHPVYLLTLPLLVIAIVLTLLHLLPIEWCKALFYSPLASLSEQDRDEFFDGVLMKRRIPKSWEALLQAKADGYHVLLVSASPELYLRPLLTRGLCDGLIGSRLRTRKDGRPSPLPDGKNCAGYEKVRRIGAYCQTQGLTIDKEHSIGFSDSDRDRHMLALVGTATRVTKQGRHIPYMTRKKVISQTP